MCIRDSFQGMQCGAALIEARAQVEDGGWYRWLDENVTFTAWTAAQYMRVAHHRDALFAAGRVFSLPTATEYLRSIGASAPHDHIFTMKADERKAEARRLRKEGVTQDEIAEFFDVSRATVRRWVDPVVEKRDRQKRERDRKVSRAARKALREKEERADRDRLAKSAGGAVSKAYALVRRTGIELDTAMQEASGGAERDALRSAMAAVHRAEDEIVRALRVRP